MHIGSMLEHGNINDPSFGWCVMDPTSPISRDSEMSILALAWVGPQGMLRLDNAIAKAFALRDHAVLDWALWDPDGVDMMFCADGEFRWPGAVNVNGLIVGVQASRSNRTSSRTWSSPATSLVRSSTPCWNGRTNIHSGGNRTGAGSATKTNLTIATAPAATSASTSMPPSWRTPTISRCDVRG